jgi:hypothetical protein
MDYFLKEKNKVLNLRDYIPASEYNPLDFVYTLKFYFRQKREVMSSNSPVSF